MQYKRIIKTESNKQYKCKTYRHSRVNENKETSHSIMKYMEINVYSTCITNRRF